MPDKLTFTSQSATADIRALVQNEFQKTDEQGNVLGYEWQAPRPEACIGPMQTANLVLAEKRRLILETSSADDILIPVTNEGQQNTLRVSRLSKKSGDITPLGFVAPKRNGISADPIVSAINSKFSLIVQQLPK
jgi:hypothetical protein